MFNKETLVVVLTLAVSGYHYYRFKRIQDCSALELRDFASMLLAIGAIVSSADLIVTAAYSSALRDLLKEDIIVLLLGSIAVIWISIQEITRLFDA